MDGGAYLWIKAVHVIFVIFWLAGLFMLPRYFVYHQEVPVNSPESALWSDRQAKLLKIILWPSLVAVWAAGLTLAHITGALFQGWFHAKLVMVAMLTIYHLWLAGYHRALARGERHLSGRSLRLLNEVPSLAAIVIVVLVVVKPF